MMTILSWILLALIVAVDVALFFSRTTYFTECKKVDVNALKTSKDEGYNCGSKFLSRQITYILDSKSKGINVNPGSVISDMTKYVWGFRHFCTYSLCILLVVYAVFVFLGMITENLCIILCSVSAVWYLICVLFDKASLSSETGMAEDVLRSVINKYALMQKSYEQQKEELLVSVNSKLDSKINKNHEYAEISGTLSKTMQSVQGSIKSIFDLTKDYCDLKTAPQNSTFGDEIHVLESKVEKIEIQYKDMIKDKHLHDEDIQQYI
ncbi:MAG: hypothetical protein J6A05_07475, partial [Oscillospiraceae bacterium]|nr:hypothetical protein [Oscillospiraceae bacterium]